MIRVGFVLGAHWLGGVNYFRNLLNAVVALPDRQIEPVLFTGQETDVGKLGGFPAVEIVQSDWFDRMTPPWLLRKSWQQVFGRDPFLERLVRQHGIDVLSHADPLGPNANMPTICWIPDFQHRRLPHCFKPSERRYRDRSFMRQCRYGTRVIVSSVDAQRDLEAFAPACVGKSRVLHFVAQPEAGSEAPALAELERRYGFAAPYFHVPNQFWVHKNHRVIVDALGILKARGQEVLVIATGEPRDYRQPSHFSDLMEHAERLGVQSQFRPLGIVPYGDLVGLMCHAVALINPSRAEGWSTSVEEAKSIGKRIVLSDLPVHREQAPPAGVYFDPDEPIGLADALWHAWSVHDPVADQALVERAQSDLPARIQAFGRAYEQIVLEATGVMEAWPTAAWQTGAV
ncbi:MAG: hypothetical protein QOG89_1683 [Thermomicrobiales bacterium]|nr:hypothetical protein [Thermomicrobiales bacterium]